VQEHPVIERPVDPGLKNILDLGKIAHHAPGVQRLGADLHLDFAVVAMKIAAFSVVIQQPVAVAEMNFLRHLEHEGDYNLKDE
jgi:hypothetical protein